MFQKIIKSKNTEEEVYGSCCMYMTVLNPCVCIYISIPTNDRGYFRFSSRTTTNKSLLCYFHRHHLSLVVENVWLVVVVVMWRLFCGCFEPLDEHL